MDWCERCSMYHVSGKHFPQWLVWDKAVGEEEADTFVARTAEDAATEFARQQDIRDADYPIARNKYAPTVCVRRVGTADKIIEFQVEGETMPSYIAREVKNT